MLWLEFGCRQPHSWGSRAGSTCSLGWEHQGVLLPGQVAPSQPGFQSSRLVLAAAFIPSRHQTVSVSLLLALVCAAKGTRCD